MKKNALSITLLTFFIVYLVLFFISGGKVHAQQNESILISTTYSSKQDLDFLFKNSAQVLKYLEGEEIEKSIFLALVTPVQRLLIQKQGFEIAIIDENTDLSSYRLYFTYEAGHGDKLGQFGEVTVLNSHYTLLKLAQANPDFHIEGFDIEFFESPLLISDPLPSPKYQTATITRAPTLVPIRATAPDEKQPTRSNLLPLILIVIVVIVIGIVGAVLLRRKLMSS